MKINQVFVFSQHFHLHFPLGLISILVISTQLTFWARSPHLSINELDALTPLQSFNLDFYQKKVRKQDSTLVRITKLNNSKLSPSHPRQGVPTTVEALVLCAAVQRSLSFRVGTRFVPLCVPPLHSRAQHCLPSPSGIVGGLHIVFVPSAAQGLLLPFAATVAHGRCQR